MFVLQVFLSDLHIEEKHLHNIVCVRAHAHVRLSVEPPHHSLSIFVIPLQ